MGGSTQVSTSSSQSQPLTADQRSAIFQGAMQNMSQTNPGYIQNGQLTGPQYTAPGYQSAGTPQQIDNGDLSALQSQMTAGYTAPLDYAKSQDQTKLNSSLAGRGIWSTGLAEKAMGDLNASYAPQYAKAGAEATNAADTLANSQNQNINSLAQQNTNAQNTFNLQNANQQNQSNWAPLNFLQGIWNGTGGQTSSSDSFGIGVSGGVLH